MNAKMNIYGEEHVLELEFHSYLDNGNLAIRLMEDGFPFDMMTVNLDDMEADEITLNPTEQTYKPYVEALVELGLIQSAEPTRFNPSGFVLFHVFKLTKKAMEMERM